MTLDSCLLYKADSLVSGTSTLLVELNSQIIANTHAGTFINRHWSLQLESLF